MTSIKERFLFLFLVALLLVYHAMNFTIRDGTVLGRYLKVAWKDSGFPEVRVERKSPFFDRGSEIIGRTGFLLKYLAKHSNPWFFFGTQETPVDLHFRTEIPLQYTATIGVLRKEIVPKMERFISQMQMKGVHLLLLPIPTKLSIVRDSIEAPLPPERLVGEKIIEWDEEDSQAVYEVFLKGNENRAVDLFSLYKKEHEKSPGNALYVPWDYHWSSYGIALAAQALVKKLKMNSLIDYETVIEASSFAEPNYLEQLLGQIQLPQFFMKRRREFRWNEPLYQLKATNILVPARNIFIAGTSCTNRLIESPFGLPSLIENALGKKPVTVALDGGNMDGALKVLVKEHKLQKDDILIWEFPLSAALNSFNPPEVD